MSDHTVLFLFDTTHHALWSEEVAQGLSIPAQVVPAPADAEANCDLALEAFAGDRATLAAALDERGIVYRVRSGTVD